MSSLESWVPDRLPQFDQGDLQIQIGFNISYVNELAQEHKLELGKTVKYLILLASPAADQAIRLRTQGEEKVVSLMDENLEKPRLMDNVGEKTVILNLSRNRGEDWMEAANRYHITIEELCTRMLLLGVRIFQTKDNPGIDYILRIGDNNINFKNIDFSKVT